MELRNDFVVPVPPDTAWGALTDVERVARCVPGMALKHTDGDGISGRLRVRVGPVETSYEGTARFVTKDEQARLVRLRAEGRQEQETGTAQAEVTARLHALDRGTRVTLDTDLELTGSPAQFGRAVLAQVAQQALGRFATNLSEGLAIPGPRAARWAWPVFARPLWKHALLVLAAASVFVAGWVAGRRDVNTKRAPRGGLR